MDLDGFYFDIKFHYPNSHYGNPVPSTLYLQ